MNVLRRFSGAGGLEIGRNRWGVPEPVMVRQKSGVKELHSRSQ